MPSVDNPSVERLTIMRHFLIHLLENAVSLLAGMGVGVYLYRRYSRSSLEKVKALLSKAAQ